MCNISEEGYPGYLTRFLASSRIFDKISTIQLDIKFNNRLGISPDNLYLTGYLRRYLVSGRIAGLLDMWPLLYIRNIWNRTNLIFDDISCIRPYIPQDIQYSTGYQIHHPSLAGYVVNIHIRPDTIFKIQTNIWPELISGRRIFEAGYSGYLTRYLYSSRILAKIYSIQPDIKFKIIPAINVGL